MSYAAAVDQLYALGHELAAPPAGGVGRRKFDLDHMRVLAAALGDPQRRYASVLVAGTNGKGSTSATLASIMAAAGYRTGLYTSPHLARVNERIRVAVGNPGTGLMDIGDEEFARLYFQVDEAARGLVDRGDLPHSPSYFEVLTALAFLHFTGQRVEIAILEVGLGGRLDATNIVEPVVSVITDIALDHQEYLGETLAEITREKAGILRAGGTLVTLPQHPEANQAIGEVAERLAVRGVSAAEFMPVRGSTSEPSNHAPELFAGNSYDVAVDGAPLEVRSPLAGRHQQRNVALAIAAAVELRNNFGYNIGNAALEEGIRRTVWPGRLEFLPPDVLLDVAHNPAGAWTLRAAIAELPDATPRTLLFSCLRDKDVTSMAQILFPLFDSTGGRPWDHIVLAPMDNPRAASGAELIETARRLDTPAHLVPSPAAGLELAHALTPKGGLVIVTGSIYLVGEIRELVVSSALRPGSQHQAPNR